MTGIAAGTGALVGVALGWPGVLALACAALCVAIVARGRSIAAPVLLALALAMVGAWRAGGVRPLELRTDPVSNLGVVRVVNAPTYTSRFQHFVVEPEAEPATRLCVTARALPPLRLGDLVQLSGQVDLAIDATQGQRAFLHSRQCVGSLFATNVTLTGSSPGIAREIAGLRARLGDVLRTAAPGDAGVLLTGLVTGDDAGFSEERREAFVRTGTTHLTAVSGSNLALVAGILASIGAATFGRHRLPWQVVTIAGVWTYALVSGAQPPALRAAIVATAAILAFLFGRAPDFPTLIMLAAGIMVLIEPRQIDALGFRLSVAASLALAFTLPALLQRDRASALASVLAATAAAQIATIPLLVPVFGTISLLSIPANALVAPLVALAMPLAAVAAVVGLVWQPLGDIVVAPAAFAATATIGIVDRLGGDEAYVRIGIPPLHATIAIAATCAALLFVMSSRAGRRSA